MNQEQIRASIEIGFSRVTNLPAFRIRRNSSLSWKRITRDKPDGMNGFVVAVITFCLSLVSVGLYAQSLEVARNFTVTVNNPQTAFVEPVVAVNPEDPDHIIVAAISMPTEVFDGWWDSWRVQVLVSTDAGKNWKQVRLPDFTTFSGDPWLYWDKRENLYLSVLAENLERNDDSFKPYLFHSEDGGFSWSKPKRVIFNEDKTFDHPVIAGRSDEPGQPLYIVSMGNFSSIVVSKYFPEKDTFEPLPSYQPDDLNNAMTGAAVFPDGEILYGFFTNSKGYPTEYKAIRLSKQERTVEESLISEEFLPITFFPLAVDHSRTSRVYAIWAKSETESGFYLNYSDDYGASWSEPVKIKGTSDGSFASRPFMTINNQGHIGVFWVDNRNSSEFQCWDTFFTVSTDGGSTFLPEIQLSERISCPDFETMGMGGRRFLVAGDYSGIATDKEGSFYVSYPQVSELGIYEIYLAKIRYNPN